MGNQALSWLKKTENTISLIASENVISPLARLPFASRESLRYHLEDLRLFGDWFFHGGKFIGEIEESVLKPTLKRMLNAKFVNVRPISGMNCLTVALAGLTDLGDSILTLSPSQGGHPSTKYIAERLGLKVDYFQVKEHDSIDLIDLAIKLEDKPRLIYIDQSSFLYPIPVKEIAKCRDQLSPSTLIHYDTSHTNGLICVGAIDNPLEDGADLVGGSTHKTLPGPLKGFLVTNSEVIHDQLNESADHFVSHHDSASSISLAITLEELENCNGNKYGQHTLLNANYFANQLELNGLNVTRTLQGYTGAHQIWLTGELEDMQFLNTTLASYGIFTNMFPSMPFENKPGLRLSSAELTRCGAGESEFKNLAYLIAKMANEDLSASDIDLFKSLASQVKEPKYCYEISN